MSKLILPSPEVIGIVKQVLLILPKPLPRGAQIRLGSRYGLSRVQMWRLTRGESYRSVPPLDGPEARRVARQIEADTIVWPDDEELAEMLRQEHIEDVAEEIGCTSPAIRHRCRRRGIDSSA